jgi:hypothetical protein
MLKLSRSHLGVRKFCPRKGWLEYWYPVDGKPRGVVPLRLNAPQATGTLAHSMVEGVLRYVMHNGVGTLPLNNILASCVREWIAEVEAKGFEAPANIMLQAALAEGMVRAWVARRLPFIVEFYDVVAVEEEWEFELPAAVDIKLMVRIDAVLRRKLDNVLEPLEFKSTGFDKESYFESWRYATQTLLHLMAVKEHFPDAECNSVLMEFLLKGYHRRDAQGVDQFYSPLVRILKMEDTHVYIPYDSKLSNRKGVVTLYSYDYPHGGVEGWVATLDDMKLDSALATREIQRNDDELEEWLEQAAHEASRIQTGLTLLEGPYAQGRDEVTRGLLREYFPARLDQECFADRYGYPCCYNSYCHGEVDDLLESGLFVPREAHHAGEFEEED